MGRDVVVDQSTAAMLNDHKHVHLRGADSASRRSTGDRGIARYSVSNLIASCAQPDMGIRSNEVPGR
jgi:hypothetical protein